MKNYAIVLKFRKDTKNVISIILIDPHQEHNAIDSQENSRNLLI